MEVVARARVPRKRGEHDECPHHLRARALSGRHSVGRRGGRGCGACGARCRAVVVTLSPMVGRRPAIAVVPRGGEQSPSQDPHRGAWPRRGTRTAVGAPHIVLVVRVSPAAWSVHAPGADATVVVSRGGEGGKLALLAARRRSQSGGKERAMLLGILRSSGWKAFHDRDLRTGHWPRSGGSVMN